MPPSSWIILIWFATSILVEVVGILFFALWLTNRGVKLVFGLTGIPGYLEHRYAIWCADRGRSPRRVIVIRALLLLNMIIAILCAIPILSASAAL